MSGLRHCELMPCTVVILTLNEEVHLARAIASVARLADKVIVVDSGSTDGTIAIAKEAGAQVLSHPFVTQAKQFNWALNQLPNDTDWVFRLDADEFLTDGLAQEIEAKLDGLAADIAGVRIGRRMHFLRQPVRRGGLFPIRVIRLFRRGKGQSEDRWMDEHIVVDGPVADFDGEIIDDNLKELSWWIEKHNHYASREAVELLNLEYGFMPRDGDAMFQSRQVGGTKRWMKENVYAKLPGSMRAFAYFFYRYVLRLGFLDTREGRTFHVLQGLWYRYLVDTKVFEVKAHMHRTDVGVKEAIKQVLKINV